MLENFIKNKDKLPKNLIVYSLSGGKNYESDEIKIKRLMTLGTPYNFGEKNIPIRCDIQFR